MLNNGPDLGKGHEPPGEMQAGPRRKCRLYVVTSRENGYLKMLIGTADWDG